MGSAVALVFDWIGNLRERGKGASCVELGRKWRIWRWEIVDLGFDSA